MATMLANAIATPICQLRPMAMAIDVTVNTMLTP